METVLDIKEVRTCRICGMVQSAAFFRRAYDLGKTTEVVMIVICSDCWLGKCEWPRDKQSQRIINQAAY